MRQRSAARSAGIPASHPSHCRGQVPSFWCCHWDPMNPTPAGLSWQGGQGRKRPHAAPGQPHGSSLLPKHTKEGRRAGRWQHRAAQQTSSPGHCLPSRHHHGHDPGGCTRRGSSRLSCPMGPHLRARAWAGSCPDFLTGKEMGREKQTSPLKGSHCPFPTSPPPKAQHLNSGHGDTGAGGDNLVAVAAWAALGSLSSVTPQRMPHPPQSINQQQLWFPTDPQASQLPWGWRWLTEPLE